MEGERLRCEPIEAAILRQHQGALSVHLYRDEVLIELSDRFIRCLPSAEMLHQLERHKRGEQVEPGTYTLLPP